MIGRRKLRTCLWIELSKLTEVRLLKLSLTMAEETQVSSEIPVTMAAEIDHVPIKDLDQEKKEEEETTLDGEFIKVEKEPLADATGEKKHNPSSVTESNSATNREFLEAEEKKKELELELERVAKVLKHSELENAGLKDEITLTNEKFREFGKKYEELELSHKKLQDHILETKAQHTLQLNSLKESLQAEEAMHEELINTKEGLNTLSLELERSRKKIHEFEQELQHSFDEARKFEELHEQSGSQAESEARRALELEKLLEAAKRSAKEVEDRVVFMQEELDSHYSRIAENHKVEQALRRAEAELTAKEALVDELTRKLNMRKASESQAKEDISVLENLFTSTKEEFQYKVFELEEIKLKIQQEVKKSESAQQDLGNVRKEKEALEEKLKSLEERKDIELENVVQASNAVAEEAKLKLREAEEKNIELEKRLNLEELKISDATRELRELASRNSELEKELKNATQNWADHEGRASLTHQRSLELEDLVHVSHSKVEHSNKKVSELESLLKSEKSKTRELEEQVNAMEKKSGNAEAGSKKYANKVSELSEELEAFQAKATSLEQVVRMANEKERELIECLDVTTKERLRIENDLKSAEDQLEQQGRMIEQATERNFELESLHTFVTNESGLKLQEMISDFGDKDSEAKSLYEKMKNIEDNIKALKLELDQSSVKVASLEYKNEELILGGQKLQSQISSLTEENHVLNQAKQDANNELKTVRIQLEEQLMVAKAKQKEEVESVRAAAAAMETELRSSLKDQVHKAHDKDAQKELELAQSSIVEQKKADSPEELECGAAAKNTTEEFEAQEKQVMLLQERVRELEQKLQLADAKSKEKGDGGTAEQITSRDVGSSTPTPSRRKSKKKSEATLAQSSSFTEKNHTQTSEVSSTMPFKVILGVALVSIIIGIILGKRY